MPLSIAKKKQETGCFSPAFFALICYCFVNHRVCLLLSERITTQMLTTAFNWHVWQEIPQHKTRDSLDQNQLKTNKANTAPTWRTFSLNERWQNLPAIVSLKNTGSHKRKTFTAVHMFTLKTCVHGMSYEYSALLLYLQLESDSKYELLSWVSNEATLTNSK